MRRADAEDLALAAMAIAVGQLDVWAPVLSDPHVVGPDWLVAGCYVVTAASLAFRRRAPMAVFWVVLGVTTTLAAVFGASEGPGSLLPAVVAVYSVAAHCDRRRALAAGVATVVMVALRELNNPDNTSWHEFANAMAWNLSLVAAWLLGSYLRTRWLYAAELADRVRRTEADRLDREQLAAERAARQERDRIARELHDVVAHSVSVMVLQADAAEAVIERDPARSAAGLRTIQETGRESLADLRRLLGMRQAAQEEVLAPQPGVSRIEEMLARVSESGLHVELVVEGDPRPLPSGVDLTAYRVVQESLTNTLKHGRAGHACVRLGYRPAHVEVEVTDDGHGGASPAAANGSGRGLLGMRERVLMFGGSLEVGPDRRHGGFRVHALLPLAEPR